MHLEVVTSTQALIKLTVQVPESPEGLKGVASYNIMMYAPMPLPFTLGDYVEITVLRKADVNGENRS